MEPEILSEFEEYMTVKRQLAPESVSGSVCRARRFFESSGWVIDEETIKTHLERLTNGKPGTYNAELRALKRLTDFLECPELVEDYKSAPVEYLPPEPPTREQVKLGFEAQTNDLGRAFYLVFATAGIRTGEALNLTRDKIDTEYRAIKPNHYTRTKRSGVTIYNREFEVHLNRYLESRTDDDPRLFYISDRKQKEVWNLASEAAGVRITPKALRAWHSTELGALGVPDRYVDILQGRAPRTVIGKHYTGKGLEQLRRIYDNAGLRVTTIDGYFRGVV